MRRDLLLVFLLGTGLATAMAQSDKTPDKKPATEHAAAAARTQKKEAVSKQKEAAPAKTEAPQGTTSEAATKTPSEQTDSAQVKTDAEEKAAEPQADQEPKLKSVPGGQALGMSVLGNEETPKSLVIVPWKSSEVGRATGISPMLDDSRQPVDKEVFMRELSYYEIRSEKKP
jgi:hypothetical protein